LIKLNLDITFNQLDCFIEFASNKNNFLIQARIPDLMFEKIVNKTFKLLQDIKSVNYIHYHLGNNRRRIKGAAKRIKRLLKYDSLTSEERGLYSIILMYLERLVADKDNFRLGHNNLKYLSSFNDYPAIDADIIINHQDFQTRKSILMADNSPSFCNFSKSNLPRFKKNYELNIISEEEKLEIYERMKYSDTHARDLNIQDVDILIVDYIVNRPFYPLSKSKTKKVFIGIITELGFSEKDNANDIIAEIVSLENKFLLYITVMFYIYNCHLCYCFEDSYSSGCNYLMNYCAELYLSSYLRQFEIVSNNIKEGNIPLGVYEKVFTIDHWTCHLNVVIETLIEEYVNEEMFYMNCSLPYIIRQNMTYNIKMNSFDYDIHLNHKILSSLKDYHYGLINERIAMIGDGKDYLKEALDIYGFDFINQLSDTRIYSLCYSDKIKDSYKKRKAKENEEMLKKIEDQKAKERSDTMDLIKDEFSVINISLKDLVIDLDEDIEFSSSGFDDPYECTEQEVKTFKEIDNFLKEEKIEDRDLVSIRRMMLKDYRSNKIIRDLKRVNEVYLKQKDKENKKELMRAINNANKKRGMKNGYIPVEWFNAYNSYHNNLKMIDNEKFRKYEENREKLRADIKRLVAKEIIEQSNCNECPNLNKNKVINMDDLNKIAVRLKNEQLTYSLQRFEDSRSSNNINMSNVNILIN